MSLKNLLDLRKKDIQIIERIIFKKRPFHKELLLILTVIGVASGVIWGISKADNIIVNREVTDKGFSAIGTVSNITETEISLVDAKGSNKDQSSYTLSTLSLNKIETKDYQPLLLSDIKVGDRVIVQGRQTKEGDIIIGRLISFGINTLLKEQTATTTEATTTATTTSDTQASSTEQATSSPSIMQTIKDVVSDTFSNIVDAITGSTGTSTEPQASSTEPIATTTEPTASTTDTNTQEATTTEPATPPTSTQDTTPAPKVDEPAPEEKAPTEPTPETPQAPATPELSEQQESLPPPAPPVTEPTS